MLLLALLVILEPSSAQAQVKRDDTAPRRFGLAEPSWFLAGFGTEKHGRSNDLLTDPHNQMKFRFVFRMRVIPLGGYADGFYASFEQSSFWNPYKKYAPALDNTYTPQAFFYWDNGIAKRKRGWRWWKPSLSIAYNHQSNGLGAEESRTWNRVILRAEYGDLERHTLQLNLGVWYPFNDMDNPDIEDQLGWGDVSVVWQPLVERYPDGIRVFGLHASTYWGVTGRIFKRFQLDIYAHPLLLNRRLAWMPTLMLQFFTGRGESLMLYNRDTHALRIGIVVFP